MKTRHVWLCIAVAALFFACDRTTEVTEVVAPGPTTCAQCHDPSNVITGKQTQWAASVHGSGEAYLRGTRSSCAGCHSGNAFAERLKAGLDPDELTAGDPDPTRQDCRACHMVHETYTEQDFALKTSSPVTFYAGNIAGMTFNGGQGNLCVNCHQPRRTIPDPVGGVISGISSHWGPHHGPQSAMLLGLAGGGVTGSPSGHYAAVPNTCVQCHMGDGRNHEFEPTVSNCTPCHPGATNFDINGVQTQVLALADSLGAQLVALGLINENSPDGHPIVSEAPEDQAIALWNWIYVAHEDQSNGVHNSGYSLALLQEGLTRLNPPPAPAAPLVTQSRKGSGDSGSK